MTEDALNTAPPGDVVQTHSLPQEVNGDTSNGIDTSALASGGPMRSLLDVMLERQNELASKRKTKEAMVNRITLVGTVASSAKAHSAEDAKAFFLDCVQDVSHTGCLVVYPGAVLLVLELEAGVQLDCLRKIANAVRASETFETVRIVSSTEDVPFNAFSSLVTAFVAQENAKPEPIDEEVMVKSLSNINLKMLELGAHLSTLSGDELAKAVDSLNTAFPDLPTADAVVSAAVTTAPPTLNEFLEIYDTPTDIELESEQVWPAPPMLAL